MLNYQPYLFDERNRDYVEGRSSRMRTQGGIGVFGLIFLIPFVLVGMGTLAWAAKEWVDVGQLTFGSTTIEAVVVSHRIREDSEGDDYYVTYQFVTENDQTVTREQSVSSEKYTQYRRETTIPVRYVRSQPNISRIDDGSMWSTAGFITFFTLFWNAIVGVFLYVMLSMVWRSWSFNRRSQIIQGTLVTATAAKDSDGDLNVTLHYRFYSPEGREITGETSALRNDLRNSQLPETGTDLAIAYVDDQLHMAL